MVACLLMHANRLGDVMSRTYVVRVASTIYIQIGFSRPWQTTCIIITYDVLTPVMHVDDEPEYKHVCYDSTIMQYVGLQTPHHRTI